MREVALLRRGALGDVVLLGSVTAAVDARVTVVCDPRWFGVARRLVGVDAVSAWSGELPAGEVIDLQGGVAGRRRVLGVARIRKRSIRRRIRLWTGFGPRRPTVPELYGEAVGVQPVPAPWIEGWEPGDALALIPGAAFGPKRWVPERFAEVGRGWAGPVRVFGGPGEHELVERVVSAVPGAEGVVEDGFDETIGALRGCRAAVAGDTGMMHLAGALGMPVVALFGPTHPSDGFWVHRGRVVERQLSCRPCSLHRVERCRVGDHRCMDIPAGAVLEELQCAG